VNAGDLYRLGRQLLELSRVEMTDPADPDVSEAESVIIDVLVDHPGASIGEIVARTRFAQSHVSASVGRMRKRNWVHTSTDPADRRRTLVWPVASMVIAISGREERDVGPILRTALEGPDPDGDFDPAAFADVISVLGALHLRLTRRAVRRLTSADPAKGEAISSAAGGPTAERTGRCGR